MKRYGDTRKEYQELFDIYWPIGVGVFVIIVALVVFVVLRFRSSSDEFPKGKDKSMPAEGLYALVVAGIATVLVYFTFTTMSDIEPRREDAAARPARDPGLLVKVTAAKWRWRFDYPAYGITQQGPIPTLVVPVDTPVRFEQTSRDVIHSFWIPELRFKRDAFPGRTTTFTLRFPEQGFTRQGGECAEFCGLDHADMNFNVNVLGPAEFRTWVRERQAEESRS